MPANTYHFVEQWMIPGYTPDQVYAVLSNACLVPQWWSGVYLEAVPLGDYDAPVVGARVRAKARGFLPYTLDFVLEALVLEPGRLVEVKASGDFDGVWRAQLVHEDHGTRVAIDWKVTVNMPLIRYLSPVLKPLFAMNHNWTTPRGQQGMIRYLAQRHRPAATPAPALDIAC
ncbi:MAG: SRPBCC family protein [Deltaproteobacteria bacterium]|nr:SRPBCC family protein [Deltaproteobacteria bacterium]